MVFRQLKDLNLDAEVIVGPSLARGLNYYTGAIIEVKALDVQLGSICGGGRYDDLTGIFGLPGVSGVGVSFGAERIYDVLAELNGFLKIF
jgi:histidyl-tRNA synthetase